MPTLDKPRPDISKNLKKVRALRGYSQQYMAAKLGLSDQKEYSRLERKGERLNIGEVHRIAEVLEISVPDLLGFDEKYFFNNCSENHVVGTHNTYHSGDQKERELYDQQIAHLQEEVLFLRRQLEKHK